MRKRLTSFAIAVVLYVLIGLVVQKLYNTRYAVWCFGALMLITFAASVVTAVRYVRENPKMAVDASKYPPRWAQMLTWALIVAAALAFVWYMNTDPSVPNHSLEPTPGAVH